MKKLTIGVVQQNNVIVKLRDNEEQMYGNIIVADMGKERPSLGDVIAVGEGIHTINGVLIPTKIKKGDIVLFPTFSAVKIPFLKEEYVTVKENDIITTLEENE